jgi:competence protein ComEA
LGYAFAVLFGLLIGGLILLLNKKPETQEIKILPTATQTSILVHIVGEINNPGVYEMSNGSRVQDLIDTAGGFTDKAHIEEVNLASNIYDGQKIRIPSEKDLASTDENDLLLANRESDTEYLPININYCTAEELIELPGIGQTRAEAIIDYREQNGNFEVIEDIMNVSGIGQAIYEGIKDKITVK